MINGFVYVIESPSAEDILDGRTEGRSLSESLQLAGIPYRYNLVVNGNTLSEVLGNRLARAIAEFENMPPIIHFSVHGNEQGIMLTSGEFLFWHKLERLLQPLHDLYDHGLLICFSSCESFMGIQMAMVDEARRPFWALVSHTGKPTWADACVAYITFYSRFFKGHAPLDCVIAMQQATGDYGFSLRRGEQIKDDWLTRAGANIVSQSSNSQGILGLLANRPDVPDDS